MNSPLRRSMTQGLQTPELSPEALAFVRQGNPAPQTPHPVVAVRSEPRPLEEAHPSEPERKPAPAQESLPPSKASRTRAREPVLQEEPAVSRSFRLPKSLTRTLLRTSTERRINRQPPWTQEEIVKEAIEQWLRRNE